MGRIIGLALAIGAVALIVFDLITTTLEADRRTAELQEVLASIPSPSEAKRVIVEAHTATRRATVRWVFQTDMPTARILSAYRAALTAAGWSECGIRRTGYLYTGEVILHYAWCRGQNHSLVLSFDRVLDDKVKQYAVTAEWNIRWWWVNAVGLTLAVTAILGFQMFFRGSWSTQRRRGVSFRTEVGLDECRRRLESLRHEAPDGLILVRIEPSDSSIMTFELERSRSRWAQNALAPYAYGILQLDQDGTRIDIRFGFSPIAKITSGVIGLVLLGGLAVQAMVAPENTISNAAVLLVVTVSAIVIAPFFWRGHRSLVLAVITRLLEARATP